LGRRVVLSAQGLDGGHAFGHRPGQPELEVGGLLSTLLNAAGGTDHRAIVGVGGRFAKTSRAQALGYARFAFFANSFV
jgi:hypothetical protein